MRWSFRSSRKLGPLRLNFSGSGIGVSAGVRGARLSVGPAGTFVSLGVGGFQYRRKRLPDSSVGSGPSVPVVPQPTAIDPGAGFIPTATASTLALVAPDEVVTSIQDRLRRPNLFKAYAVVAAVVTLAALGASPILGAVVGIGLVVLGVFGHRWDRKWRCSQLIYDLDNPEIGARLAIANQAGQALASASAIWHVHHAIATDDWKRNAGAGTLIRRTPTRAMPGTLPGIELNLEPWAVPVGPQQLLLLPDRLFVWDGRSLAGVPYESLSANARTLRFIEDDRVPHDARIVDTTWQYVNKKGGPDRRFANNRQLPVVEYGELLLSTASGLRVFVQTSTPPAAHHAAQCLTALRERARFANAPSLAPSPYAPAAQVPAVSSAPSPAMATPPAADPAALWSAYASALMVVIRKLAGADRRIDPGEIELAYHVYRQMAGSTTEPAAFAQWFRTLPANDAALDQALRELASASPELRSWMVEQLERLSLADGKQTTKESERLAELRARLL